MQTNQSTTTNIPVLFVCDGQNIAFECEQGSTAEELKLVCSSLFPGLTTVYSRSKILTTAGMSGSIHQPSLHSESRVKLKVVSISVRNRTVFAKRKTKRLQATLQTSDGINLSVDKNNVIPDKPLIEKYLFPNPHTGRLKHYTKLLQKYLKIMTIFLLLPNLNIMLLLKESGSMN
jgi:hypothetical protein